MFDLTSCGNRLLPRVLVVEDDPTHRDAIATFLDPSSYFVDFASNGYEGLELALTRPYDVILTDLRMPKMTGDKMIKNLRKHPHLLGNCQIAVMSTAPYAVVGVSAYLQKPFRRSELKALVDKQASIAFGIRKRQGSKVLQNAKLTVEYDVGGMPRLVWGGLDDDFQPDPRLMHSSAMQRKAKNWRIMLIFEDKEESETLANFLKFHGFEVNIMRTEIEHFSFPQGDFHLILTDCSIGEDTIQLIRMNSRKKSYMPILMLSQSPLPVEHVDFFLTKPIDSGSLVSTLSTVAQMVSEERRKFASPYAALQLLLAPLRWVIPTRCRQVKGLQPA